jgi:hypothetical protein
MLWSIFFQNLALFRVQNANFFAKFFGENILKIIASVPDQKTRKNPHQTRYKLSKQNINQTYAKLTNLQLI